MYICQQLEELTDRSYSRGHWRLVTFRVVLDGQTHTLRWERHSNGIWHHRYSDSDWGKRQARKNSRRGIPFLNTVYHGKRVTDREIAKLTGLPANICRDRLLIDAVDNGELDNLSTVHNFIDEKHRPPVPIPPEERQRLEAERAAAAVTRDRDRRLTTATERAVEYARRVQRYTRLQRKWERIAARLQRRQQTEQR